MGVALTEIQVTRLFGMFDHTVKLNQDDRLTIITAPNGFGKTVLLRLTSAFFTGRYHEFFRTGFREFRLCFNDNTRLSVHKEQLHDGGLLARMGVSDAGQDDEDTRSNIEIILDSP